MFHVERVRKWWDSNKDDSLSRLAKETSFVSIFMSVVMAFINCVIRILVGFAFSDDLVVHNNESVWKKKSSCNY